MGHNTTDLCDQLVTALRAGQPVAQAIVARTEGSAPQVPGARMLVFADGRTSGTVGGGPLEAEISAFAAGMAGRNSAVFREFGLTEHDPLGMVCGGRLICLVEGLTHGDLPLYEALQSALQRQEPLALVTIAPGPADTIPRPAHRLLTTAQARLAGGLPAGVEDTATATVQQAMQDGKPRLVPLDAPGRPGAELQDRSLFVEPFSSRPGLVVVGAGHVGQAVALLGHWLGFAVTVLDNRPDFVTTERFPEADRLICEDFTIGLRSLSVSPSTYVVLVTRGHDWDEACLRAALDTPAAYIGMIGSRRRVGLVLDRLRGEGRTDDEMGRVHSPIGLDIGAETVEEIAMSIMAEVIAVRRRQSAPG